MNEFLTYRVELTTRNKREKSWFCYKTWVEFKINLTSFISFENQLVFYEIRIISETSEYFNEAKNKMKLSTDKDTNIKKFLKGPELLEQVFSELTDADLDTAPREGGWTARQIVHHLVDGDDLWKMGIKIALGNEKAEFSLQWYQEYPQEYWADRWAYEKRSLEESLAFLKATRAHIVQLLDHVPDSWNRSILFRNANDEVEKVSVGFIIEMQANHVVHHLKQIENICKSK
jgi:uncharacterized damage-inducible protein DinB